VLARLLDELLELDPVLRGDRRHPPGIGGARCVLDGSLVRGTPVGSNSGWRIDDVYVDPFKQR
jgi:hypothetical protein